MSNIGCKGITLSGGDTKSLTRGESTVQNSIIRDYALWKRTWSDHETTIHSRNFAIEIMNFHSFLSPSINQQSNLVVLEIIICTITCIILRMKEWLAMEMTWVQICSSISNEDKRVRLKKHSNFPVFSIAISWKHIWKIMFWNKRFWCLAFW